MRIRLPLGWRAFLLAAFLLLFVATVPLRVALDQLGFDERGLSARQVGGSVWSGRLTEARLRGVALGDLEAGLALLPLLVGEARVGLETPAWRGTIFQSSDSSGVAGLSGRIGGDGLPAALPIAAVDLTDVAVRFRDGACVDASGGARVEPRAGAGTPVNVGLLEGNLRCDGAALLVPLTSGSGRERIDLRLFADGRFRLSLVTRPGDPAMVAALTAAGFIATAEGLTLTTEGAL